MNLGAASLREPLRRHLSWTIAASVMIAALLWPALWNGFPIVFHDTGGYLARPFEGTLAFGRSAFYGAFLALGIPLGFWPNVAAQAALIAWLVVLTLRTHGFGGRPWLAAATVVGLSGVTGLAWFASHLMPDILVPVAALSIYLLAFRAQAIGRGETILLGAVLAAAMASHMSTLTLALALLAFLAFLALLRPLAAKLRLSRPHLAPPAVAVALGVLLGPLSNLAIAGRFAFTPGGANFVFGRLLESGIVARYLSEQCPDPTLRLCAMRDKLPATVDKWFWDGASPLVELGGTDNFAPEAQRIVLASLLRYPGQCLETALSGTAVQFFNVGIGYALEPPDWHARWALERFAPDAPFPGSRQQTTGSDLSWLSIIHIPVASIAIAALPVLVLLAWQRRVRPASAALSVMMLAALLANAAICGSFSVPADRYQNRLVPVAPLATWIAVLGWRRRPVLKTSSWSEAADRRPLEAE
jgi:hypothetical protein